MRVVVTNLAWIERKDLNPIDTHILTNDLTIVPKVTSSFTPDPAPVRLYAMNEKWLGVPVAYYLKKRPLMNWKDVREDWKLSQGRPLGDIQCAITLRPEDQQLAHDDMVAHLQQGPAGVGLLSAFTAFGKSVTSLRILATLGVNSILLVHRESLLDQWEKNAKRFWPGAKVGRIIADECEFEDCDIVIASVQSLMYNGGKKYPSHLWGHFGALAVDEIHTFGAQKFGSVAPKFSSRYKFGVSGTIRRADKCENVFKFVLGDVVHTASDKNRLNPTIHVRNTGFVPKGNVSFLQKPALETMICKSEARNKLVAKDIVRALKAGRHPLVVASRLDVFERLKPLVNQMCKAEGVPFPRHGMFIGGKTTAEREAASQCEVVYATYQIIKEGVDIPRLDVLHMVTPISDPEQTVGRVCRRLEGKKPPLVLDYVDFAIERFAGSFNSRLRLYRSLNWDVQGIKI